MSKKIIIHDLGSIPFKEAWQLQTTLHQELIALKRADDSGNSFKNHTLLLCEHPHVFTLGKSGDIKNLLQPMEKMHEIDAEYHEINRGGDITYHGPGQLVAYPILDLEHLFTDVHRYIRSLEAVIIAVLTEFGIQADRIPGLTGVWIDVQSPKPRKICAIGVHLSRWVSLHGLAFNVNPDLTYFRYIIPCGIQPDEKSVTSMQQELNSPVEMVDVKNSFIKHFLNTFELEQIS